MAAMSVTNAAAIKATITRRRLACSRPGRAVAPQFSPVRCGQLSYAENHRFRVGQGSHGDHFAPRVELEVRGDGGARALTGQGRVAPELPATGSVEPSHDEAHAPRIRNRYAHDRVHAAGQDEGARIGARFPDNLLPEDFALRARELHNSESQSVSARGSEGIAESRGIEGSRRDHVSRRVDGEAHLWRVDRDAHGQARPPTAVAR